MTSAATTTFEIPVDPAAARAVIERVLGENKHTVQAVSDAAPQVRFVTKKTLFTWELQGEITITPTASGSTVAVSLDTLPGRPTALLDGKKNEKAALKLADQIRAAA